MKKEKIYKITTWIFMVLTFIGAIYVLISDGSASAGFAVVPCLFTMIFSGLCLREKSRK